MFSTGCFCECVWARFRQMDMGWEIGHAEFLWEDAHIHTASMFRTGNAWTKAFFGHKMHINHTHSSTHAYCSCWCVRDHTHACLHRYDSAFMQKVVVMATPAPVIPLPSLFILSFPPTLLFPVLHSCLSLFVSSFLLFCFLYRILSMWFLFFFFCFPKGLLNIYIFFLTSKFW